MLSDTLPDARRWMLLVKLLKGWPRSSRDDAINTAIAGLSAWPDALRAPQRRGRPLWPLIRTMTVKTEAELREATQTPDLSVRRLILCFPLSAKAAEWVQGAWPELTALSAYWTEDGARHLTDAGFTGLTELFGPVIEPAAGQHIARSTSLSGVHTWALSGQAEKARMILRTWMNGEGLPNLRVLCHAGYLFDDAFLDELAASPRGKTLTGLDGVTNEQLSPGGFRRFLQTDGLRLERLRLCLEGWQGHPLDGMFDAPALQSLREMQVAVYSQRFWNALMDSPLRSLRVLDLQLGGVGEVGSYPPGRASAVLGSVETLSVRGDRGMFAGGWLSSPHLAKVKHLSLNAGYLKDGRVEALMAGPAIAGLETLNLNGNMSSEAVQALAKDERLSSLHTLQVPSASLNMMMLNAWLRAPALKSLAYVRVLRLKNAWEPEEKAVLETLSTSSMLSRLLDFQVEGTWIQPDNARLLANAPHLHPDLRARFRRMS
ncbi:MAG: hypothetical protein AAFV53_00140 [Myxococcota bacterium]